MAFKSFSGIINATGNLDINIQQDNALKEWDIFQISTLCPNPANCPAVASVFLNGFFLCNSYHAGQDTAVGPPDVILSRGDTLTVSFSTGTPGDQTVVSIWYTEYDAGTVVAGLAT